MISSMVRSVQYGRGPKKLAKRHPSPRPSSSYMTTEHDDLKTSSTSSNKDEVLEKRLENITEVI